MLKRREALRFAGAAGLGGGMEFNMRTLRTVKCGDTVQVAKVAGGGAIKRRIMDMGITKGTEIFVRKVAPLGDPVEVTVRGYELSLRKADAEIIEVE
jgi:ferrous iron transport protein A